MLKEPNAAAATLYRKLPSLSRILEQPQIVDLLRAHSHTIVVQALRGILARLRGQIAAGDYTQTFLDEALLRLPELLETELHQALRHSLRPVINATGIILQTNLGRAPLSEAAIENIARVARGYCNLEVDLETGERTYRDGHVEQLILDVLTRRSGLTQREQWSAAVVNNCAAACFLALDSIARGGEVIVSRGELVEIGGGFRIPDILERSGAILREVGTTNRTRIADYERAITPLTRLILRVHRSNFRIEGFTEQPTLAELTALGQRHNIPIFDDQGTGALLDFGLQEASLSTSVAANPALIACSGDKLLGGPQCGLLLGTKAHIDRIHANPLFRAMRVDKLIYAALESTLLAYLADREDTLPTVAMLRLPAGEIERRCRTIAAYLTHAEVVETRTMVGGGTTPGASLPSFALSLQHPHLSEAAYAAHLRGLDLPIMARIHGGRVLLDLRTIPAAQDTQLTALLLAAEQAR